MHFIVKRNMEMGKINPNGNDTTVTGNVNSFVANDRNYRFELA